MRTARVILMLTLALAGGAHAGETEARAFLNAYCIKCHGAEVQKGDRQFDPLNFEAANPQSLETWQEILDQLNLGEMPPAKEKKKPAPGEVRELISWLTGALDAAYRGLDTRHEITLRRLNRFEYRNTMRDLLQLNIESFDPTDSFPPDSEHEGFDNLAGTLVTSDYLLERLLEAAAASVEKAVMFGPRPVPISLRFGPGDFGAFPRVERPMIAYYVNAGGQHLDLAHGDAKSFRAHAAGFTGVPASGYYTLRIEAAGILRKHPYDAALLEVDPEEPIKMEVLATDPAIGPPGYNQNASDRVLANVALRDNDRTTYEVRAWLDRGFVPVIRYPNGPQPIKQVLARVAQKHHAEALPDHWRDGASHPITTNAAPGGKWLSDVYQGPRVRLFSLTIEGPETHAWPPASHQAIFGPGEKSAEQVDVPATLHRFASAAFRRPVSDAESRKFADFAAERRQHGDSAEAAIKAGLKAILASPHFFYLAHPRSEDGSTDLFAVASRLSYFLWSSMPDDRLLEAAATGRLADRAEVRSQAERMLNDPKARAFTEHFTDTWLRLNKLGSMPPDSRSFKVYYTRNLEPLMKAETRCFFQHVLEADRPVTELLDSDYTFANRYLADLYGIPGVTGDELRKVSLPPSARRGGLLGQASILTVTANGVETSPVVRGVWVLENLLGTPPKPPPPDVPAIEPDIRGTTTIRQQLDKHRNLAACATCHDRIDPMGFPLESFDPIGRYRETYEHRRAQKRHPIETAVELPDGQMIHDVNDLKRHLLERKDQFVHCLAEKLFTYASGRKLGAHDRPAVDAIVAESKQKNYGLRDLVLRVAASEAVRGPSGEPK